MKAKLQIRNFGPIKDIDIELSKFNILIGPHASGKSTISKVLCVIQSYFFEVSFEEIFSNQFDVSPYEKRIENRNDNRLNKLLINYRVENFQKKNTYWFFEDDLLSFEFKDGLILIKSKQTWDDLSPADCFYIPAERIALPMINDSLFELTHAQSSLPGYFLQFGKAFTIARKNQKLFNFPILDVDFEHREGRNIVTLPTSKTLLLEETSSAIQAILPLLVILQYPVKIAALLVIEELELHGFPMLQKTLLNYLVESTKQSSLKDAYVVLPTHSPYILSVANNLLFAAKVAKQDNQIATEVDKIIGKDSWIEKEDFSAYYIKDGRAKSILNEKTGLIDENELDGISEDLAGEFDALMELYNPAIA